MSDPTAPGDVEDAVGALSITPAASASPDGRPGGVGRASALRSAEAPRGKVGTPGSNKPMITTVAPWALPSRTRTASGAQRRHTPRVPSFAVPSRPTAPTNDASSRGDDEQDDLTEETSTRDASKPSRAPSPPRAFLDHCPGLSDKDSRLDVRHVTYGALFAEARRTNTRIAIPTFQRAYRWDGKTAARFFRDVATRGGDPAARVKGGHGTGKCLFRRARARDSEESDSCFSSYLLCLDGQQRCVTAALAVAAIRDAAERALFFSAPRTSADDKKVWPLAAETRRDLEETIAKADAALFLESVERRVDGVGHRACAGGAFVTNDARRATPRREKARTTISPSRADRAAFAACVGGGFFEATGALSVASATHFMVAAKRALDAEASLVKTASLADALEATLREASLTYVEILGPDHRVDLAQAFQWLQEKTLFAASAVLWNATPGAAFAACDLARNYLLASTLSGSVEAQEEAHRTQWLEPLESRVRRRPSLETHCSVKSPKVTRAGETCAARGEKTDQSERNVADLYAADAEEPPASHPSEHFDAFLKAFLDDDDDAWFAATSRTSTTSRRRRACAMERDLRRMLASEHAPESTKRSAGPDTAVWTYARFRSFAERVAISTLGREDAEFGGEEGLDDDDAATAGFRVDFTTSAPPPSWEGPAPADDALEIGKRKTSRENGSDPRRARDGDFSPSHDALKPPPVPVDDAVRREVVARLVAFGERAGFLVCRADADGAGPRL